MAGFSFNANGGNRQSTYTSSSLGPVYRYGAMTPAGPYTGLPGAGGAGSSSGTSSSTGTSGKTPEAKDFLNSVMSGEALPYSPDRVNRLKSAAGDENAAAESSLANRMSSQAAVGGVSANDPSFQGGLQNLQARRQTANQTAGRQIDETAEGANFDAKLRAASMLEESRRQSEALAAGVQRTAMGYMPWNQGSSGGGQPKKQSEFVGGYNSNASTNVRDISGNGEGNTLWKPGLTGDRTQQSIQANRGTADWNKDYMNSYLSHMSDDEFNDWFAG